MSSSHLVRFNFGSFVTNREKAQPQRHGKGKGNRTKRVGAGPVRPCGFSIPPRRKTTAGLKASLALQLLRCSSKSPFCRVGRTTSASPARGQHHKTGERRGVAERDLPLTACSETDLPLASSSRVPRVPLRQADHDRRAPGCRVRLRDGLEPLPRETRPRPKRFECRQAK